MRALVSILIMSVLVTSCLLEADGSPVKAPNFTSDAQWIDTDAAGKKVPHSIKGYRGHVLLIDFWEYTCINCIRDFRILKRWFAKYHTDGFDIVGVHFGEFAMGYNADNVREAASRFSCPGQLWPTFTAQSGVSITQVWPNRYLIDQNGDIVLQIEGEGNDRPMEEKIRELLVPTHPEVSQIPIDPPENTFAPSCGIPTDETYVGDWFGRGAMRIQRDTRMMGELPIFVRKERRPMAWSCSPADGSRSRMVSPPPARTPRRSFAITRALCTPG